MDMMKNPGGCTASRAIHDNADKLLEKHDKIKDDFYCPQSCSKTEDTWC